MFKKSIVTLLLLSACSKAPVPSELEKPVVTTSFYPLYFFTQQIAGDHVDLQNLTPAGAEPHDYELTPEDRMRLENSDLIVLNGSGLEPWSDDIENDLADQIVEVSKGISVNDDPHVWLSPRLAQKMVNSIQERLSAVDPKNTAYYEANAAVLNTSLSNLDMQFQAQLADCAQKNIVTSHEAFNYLASAYGFTQMPISGVSPEAEPSAQDLAELADFAKQNGVKVIFFESLVSPELSETLAEEVGAQSMVLNPIEGLTEAEMAEGKTYFTEMQNNLNNLKIALECR